MHGLSTRCIEEETTIQMKALGLKGEPDYACKLPWNYVYITCSLNRYCKLPWNYVYITCSLNRYLQYSLFREQFNQLTVLYSRTIFWYLFLKLVLFQ